MNWTLLQNSLAVSGGATFLSVVMGFTTALCLAALPPSWGKRLLVVAAVALVLPPFLVTNCWLHFLGETGVWRGWLPWNIYSLGGAVWLLALLTWPIPLVATLSAWRRLESTQLDSDPAMSGTALIRWLLWPVARVSLGQAAALTFVVALNNFAVPAILQVKVFPAEVWVAFSTNFNSGEALALSWPLFAAPLLLLFFLRRAEVPWPRQRGALAPRAFRRQLGRGWFCAAACLTFVVLFASVALPLLQILTVERTWTELPTVFHAVPGVLWNSFAFSAAAASLCLLIALAANSAVMARSRGTRFNSYRRPRFGGPDLFLWLPLLTPGVLLGIGLIWLFNRPVFESIYHSAAMVLIAWTIRYLAVSWNGVAFGFQALDHDLVEAARLDGASIWAMLRHVYWPQIAPQSCAAWYLTYLLCLWDVETLVLIYPPGGETLALRIFNLLHYGHNAQVNALCLILVALALVPLAAWTLGRRA